MGGLLSWALVYKDRFLLGLLKEEQKVLRKIVYFSLELLYGSCLRLWSLNSGDLSCASTKIGIGSMRDGTVLISGGGR